MKKLDSVGHNINTHRVSGVNIYFTIHNLHTITLEDILLNGDCGRGHDTLDEKNAFSSQDVSVRGILLATWERVKGRNV